MSSSSSFPFRILLYFFIVLFGTSRVVRAVGHLQFRVSLASPSSSANSDQPPLQLELCAREFRWNYSSSSADLASSSPDQCKFGHVQLGQPISTSSAATPKSVSLAFSHSWRQSFVLSATLWRNRQRTEDGDGSREVLFHRVERVFDLPAGSAWRLLRANFSVPDSDSVESPLSLEVRYRVECAANFFGPSCDVRCALSEREQRSGRFECAPGDGEKRCAPGWTGPGCAQRTGEEVGNNGNNSSCPCANGGRCAADGRHCLCPPGYGGDRCEKCMTSARCKGHCRVAGECECPEGKGGQFCEKDLVFCLRNTPCLNGATCLNSPDGTYTCDCAPGFGGRNCERRLTDCAQAPCRNSAPCVPMVSRHSSPFSPGFRCDCPPGFYGRFCQVRAPGGCAARPCQNGGSCADAALLVLSARVPPPPPFKCLCAAGWTGDVCDQQWDSCVQNPCQNGAACVPDPLAAPLDFVCHCPLGWRGPLCADSVDDCRGAPCLHGGTCVDELNAFRCVCPQGRGGELCQHRLPEEGNNTAEPREGKAGEHRIPVHHHHHHAHLYFPMSSPVFSLALALCLFIFLIIIFFLFYSSSFSSSQLPLFRRSSASSSASHPSSSPSISTLPDPPKVIKGSRPDEESDDHRYVLEPTFRIGPQARRHLEADRSRMRRSGRMVDERDRSIRMSTYGGGGSGIYEEIEEQQQCCHRF